MLRGGSTTWGACSPQGKPGALHSSTQLPYRLATGTPGWAQQAPPVPAPFILPPGRLLPGSRARNHPAAIVQVSSCCGCLEISRIPGVRFPAGQDAPFTSPAETLSHKSARLPTNAPGAVRLKRPAKETLKIRLKRSAPANPGAQHICSELFVP